MHGNKTYSAEIANEVARLLYCSKVTVNDALQPRLDHSLALRELDRVACFEEAVTAAHSLPHGSIAQLLALEKALLFATETREARMVYDLSLPGSEIRSLAIRKMADILLIQV